MRNVFGVVVPEDGHERFPFCRDHAPRDTEAVSHQSQRPRYGGRLSDVW